MTDDVVEFKKILFPMSCLKVLLAQSAAAEVRRKYDDGVTDVFSIMKTNTHFQQEFLKSFVEANEIYFSKIKNYIPTEYNSVLDIGCGIGLISLYIYRMQKSKLYLYDKSIDLTLENTEIAPVGFNESYEFTASLSATRDFLLLNGVDDADIELREVNEWSIEQAHELDLVVSRKSWGFHYPINEYIKEVSMSVKAGGIMITDIRHGQNGEEDVKNIFGEISVISNEKKSDLICAVKK